MEQKTGIRSLYDEFYRGYGVEIRLFCLKFLSNSMCKRASTTGSKPPREVRPLNPTFDSDDCRTPNEVAGGEADEQPEQPIASRVPADTRILL